MKGSNSVSLVTCVVMVMLIQVVTSRWVRGWVNGVWRNKEILDSPCPYQECACNDDSIYCDDRNIDVMPTLQPGNYSQTMFWMRGNTIRTIQKGRLLLPSLTRLQLNGNALTSVPGDVSHLHHLWLMNINSNNITSIDDVALPNRLKILFAKDNKIKTITLIKFNGNDPAHNSLDQLELQNNPITSIATDAFKYLKQLSQLYLWNTRLTRLPLALADLTSIDGLSLSNIPDLECTCEESSLGAWYNYLGEDELRDVGECGTTGVPLPGHRRVVTAITDFLASVDVKCGDCYYPGSASDYKGNVATSKSGLQCLQWGLEGQRYHDMTRAEADSYFPGNNMTLSANYCRAPKDHDGGIIWCYVKGGWGWEDCNIPECK